MTRFTAGSHATRRSEMDVLPQAMTVTISESGVGLAIAGEVDASNAGDLSLAILAAATDRGTRHVSQVEIDLAGVTFMDSTGLRAITDASTALEASSSRIVLRNVPRQVVRMLEIIGSSDTLAVVE
jgi:anti-sigma B factor antagonist